MNETARRALRAGLVAFANEIAKQVTEEPPQQETPGEAPGKPRLQVTLPGPDEPKNDFCTEVLERGTVRTALEPTEAVTVKRKESSP